MALEDLPQGAVLGTASVRRSALIKSVRPDISIAPLRGNIHTRVDKLDRGEYDAIVLAKAGLERMGIERPMFSMDPKVFVPAPAQGAIAVECRSDDKETLALLAAVDDADTRTAVTAERAIMRAMGAGCSSPVGINAKVTADGIAVEAVSFAFTDEPVRLSTVLPAGYTDGDIRRLSSILKGECTE
jgi:hydroxymethylbilane synthase